jgi:dynein heavy chain, axonemal
LIESLKKHPNTKDFLYLQRINRNPSEYNPYALRVEAFAKMDPNDFYTISVNGITSYRNKVSEGFTELTRWERELMLFKQLKKLPLWRYFRVWKVWSITFYAHLDSCM